MTSVRRWYMFLVSSISLNAVVWAIIALLRNLSVSELNTPRSQIAFEIAVVIIGLPFFLGHWRWLQKLARELADERESVLRQFYLYGMMAGFLAPLLANVSQMLELLLNQLSDIDRPASALYGLGSLEAAAYHLVAVLILALFWEYHRRQVKSDVSNYNTDYVRANPRRLYIYGFSGTGLIMASTSVASLIRWLLFQLGDATFLDPGYGSANIHLLLVGIPLWLVFWLWGKRLFEGAVAAEQESALRKLFLYLAIFTGVILTVVNSTLILAGGLRKLLELPSVGDIRDPLPLIIVGAILWSYHAHVLRTDASAAGELPRQAGVRRLYFYLLAGIGLLAILIGLAGDISVLIRTLSGDTFISSIREQLAWFTSTLIAGLPVWMGSWRRSQSAARSTDSSGEDERQSIIRRIYLYIFLFIAAISLLSSAIYIVSQMIELALGARSPQFLAGDLAQAIAVALMAIFVWLYHSAILRGDGRLLALAETGMLQELRLVFVDQAISGLVTDIMTTLSEEVPQLSYQTLHLSKDEVAKQAELEAIRQANVIVGPWTLIAGREIGDDWADAIAQSPGRKLLLPVHEAGLDWVGVKRETAGKSARQLAYALKQIAAGKEITPGAPLGLGTILSIIVGVLILLGILVPLVISLVEQLF